MALEVTRILLECAGLRDDIVNDDMLDTPLPTLGCDSLALLETAGRIEREFGLRLDEDALWEIQTPRALVQLVQAAS